MRRMHKKQRSGSVCFWSSGEMDRAGHWAVRRPQAVQVSDTAGTAREMEPLRYQRGGGGHPESLGRHAIVQLQQGVLKGTVDIDGGGDGRAYLHRYGF